MNYLLLSHFFYPYAGVGAKRMTALAVYLIRKNNRVFVIRANDDEYNGDILSNPLPCHIPMRQLDKYYKNLILGKITRNKMYWKIIQSLLKKKKIDVVIVSGGPFNYFKLVSKIKKTHPEIKCVLDIRDVLDGKETTNDKVSFVFKINYYFDRLTEKKAVKAADVCMTVSDSMNELYKKRYPADSEKFQNIQNGYDDITVSKETIDKIKNYSHYEDGEKDGLCVGIFGKYGTYDRRFYDILACAVKHYYEHGTKIVIKQFGYFEENLEMALKNSGLSKQYQFIPTQGYEVDILELQKCDAMITSNFISEALGTKIFDYIWINRPIIIVNFLEESEQAKIIKRFKNGFLCHDAKDLIIAFNQVDGLSEKILDKDRTAIDEFSRSSQFGKLEKMIKYNG